MTPKFHSLQIKDIRKETKNCVSISFEIPQELKVGQVLVKVHYSGICGSQLGEIDGGRKHRKCKKYKRTRRCRSRKSRGRKSRRHR